MNQKNTQTHGKFSAPLKQLGRVVSAVLTVIIAVGPVDASTWKPTALVNTEAFQVIDDSDSVANIVLKFGDTLSKTLTYIRTSSRFEFNDNVYIRAGSVPTGSGALTVLTTTRNGTGGYIGASGTVLALNSLTQSPSTMAQSPHILFGYKGTFDTNLYRPTALTLKTDGTFTAQNSLTSSGTLVFEGAASGSSLYLGTSLQGAGLSSCSNPLTSKLLYDSTTGRFSCATDQTGGGVTFGTGNVLTIGGQKYVSRQGDTMTGALTVNIQGGTVNSIGIKAINTISGAILHAEKLLRSSGSLTVESGAYLGGDLRFGNNLSHFLTVQETTAATGKNLTIGAGDAATTGGALILQGGANATNRSKITINGSGDDGGNIDIIGGDSGAGSAGGDVHITAGNGIVTDAGIVEISGGSNGFFGDGGSVYLHGGAKVTSYNDGNTLLAITPGGTKYGNVGIRTLDPSTELEVLGTISGSTVYGNKGVSSSGSLVWEGAGSGNSLFVSNSASFAGPLTFGNAISDAITVNASTWTFANDTNFVVSGGVNGLSFDTNTFSVDATNDRIGIGTTAPDTTLEVVGTISGSQLRAGNMTQSGGIVFNSGSTLRSTAKGFSGQVLVSRATGTPEWKSPTGSMVWYIGGTIATGGTQGPQVVLPFGFRPTDVSMVATGAPTGAALIVDLKQNGSSIFSVQPQINASSTTGGGGTLSASIINQGAILTLDVTQVGSTFAGSGLTVLLNGSRRY